MVSSVKKGKLERPMESSSKEKKKKARVEEEKGSEFQKGGSMATYHMDFANRKIFHGKQVTESFILHNFSLLNAKFRLVYLTLLITLSEKSYPECIRLFYANLVYVEKSDSFTTIVKGHSFQFDSDTIAELLKILRSPHIVTCIADIEKIHQFNRVEALNQVCGLTNLEARDKIKASNLTILSRLIHHIITHNLIPQVSSREIITHLDLFYMWSVLKNFSEDIPQLICSEMKACIERKNQSLPFGMLITKFLHYHKFPLKDETVVKKHCISDTYTDTTLRNMNLKKINDVWVHRSFGLRHVQVGGDNSREEAEHVDANPPQQANPPQHDTLKSDLEVLFQGMADLKNELAGMKKDMVAMSAMVVGLKENVEFLSKNVDEIGEKIGVIRLKAGLMQETFDKGLRGASNKLDEHSEQMVSLFKRAFGIR